MSECPLLKSKTCQFKVDKKHFRKYCLGEAKDSDKTPGGHRFCWWYDSQVTVRKSPWGWKEE